MSTVRGCSCKGFFYYPPWSSILIFGLMGTGASLFLYNSYDARDTVEPMLQSVQAQNTLHDVLPLSEASWITTLVVAATTVGICFVVAILRTYQKCIKNYDLQKSSKHTNRMRCCQFWEFLGLAAAVASTLWLACIIGLSATWHSRAQALYAVSSRALSRSSGCMEAGCMDAAALYFLTVQQCTCNATIIADINDQAGRLEDQTWMCIIGSGLMLGGCILAVAFVALSFAYTSKAKAVLKHRYEDYMGVKHNQALTAAQISATSAFVDAETRPPSVRSVSRSDTLSAGPHSFTGTRQGSGYASTYSYTGNYHQNSYGLTPSPVTPSPDNDTREDIEAPGAVSEDKKDKKRKKKSKSKKAIVVDQPAEFTGDQTERAPWELDDHHTQV